VARSLRQKIKKTIFKNSQLQETDFAETDLTSAVFDNCNLTQAVFDHTTLEKADFRTSYNYSIDPEINRIKKAKFSILGVSGLLDKYDIDIEK
jgi:fluoroquinolone resistance protein